jgi:hypothetical protein
MERLWEAGGRSRAICQECGKVVETRFEFRTYPLVSPRVDVPDVLVAVCIQCERIVAVPFRSTPQLNEARKTRSA